MPTDQAFPDPFLVIRASAGTGKTYALSSRYIGLLDRDVSPEQILATTFTRKAAGEILERVLVRLARASVDPSQLQELAEAIHDSSLTAERCRELLCQLAGNLHRQRVSTLDSFFAQLARTHALELELPPRWRIADEQAAARLQYEATAAVLEYNSQSDVVRLMHLVGKGDGGRRVSELIHTTVQELHERFLGSEEAAWQQVPRAKPLEAAALAKLLEELADSPADGNRMANARDADLERAYEEDWEAVLTKGLGAKIVAGETTYYRREIPPQTIARYEQLLGHARAILLAQLVNQNEGTYELLRKFDDQYSRLKAARQLLTFSDVKHRLNRYRALENGARSSHRLDGRITHLLLDEFQDTSPDQWQILEPIAQAIVGSENSSFFCVGDVKQAIYGWRGGEARLFDALDKRLGRLQVQSLAMSYRSAPPIVDVTNQVMQGLLDHGALDQYHDAVAEWGESFDEHDTRWRTRRGHVTLETAPAAGEEEKQDHVTLAHAAGRVAELQREVPGRSIAVLARRNSSVSRMIYELGRLGVAASEEGKSAITDSAAVRLILSLVRWIDHPADEISWFHLATSPLAGALAVPASRNAAHQGAAATRLRALLATDGYGPTIADWASRLVPHSSRREAHRLGQLAQLAYEYQPLATLRPSDFADYVEQRKVEAPESVRVRVMTVHQAKGLEFDIVVLPELDQRLIEKPARLAVARENVVGAIETVCLRRNKQLHKLLPERLQQMFDEDDAREIAESLCRLYVSITRPAYALHMIIAPSSDKEKALPKTPAGLIRGALVGCGPVRPGEVIFETGDPQWFRHQPQEVLPGEEQAAAAEPVQVQLAPSRSTRPIWTSPSQLESGGMSRPAAALRRDRGVATSRGTVLHALFERVAWLEDGLPADEELKRTASNLGAQAALVDDLLHQFRTALAAEPIAAVLHRTAYRSPAELGFDKSVAAELSAEPLELEVLREQRIAATRAEQLLTGLVDRLVLLRRDRELLAADVIDFKTDELPADDPAALEARVARYRPQIAAYRHAVSEMHRLPPERVAARLVFTALGRVVPM